MNEELLQEREMRINVESQNMAISENLKRLQSVALESSDIQKLLHDEMTNKDDTISSLQVELDNLKMVWSILLAFSKFVFSNFFLIIIYILLEANVL